MTDATLKLKAKKAFELKQKMDALNKELEELKNEYDCIRDTFVTELGDKAEKELGQYTVKTWTVTSAYVKASEIAKRDPKTFELFGGYFQTSQRWQVKEK